jgi:hypothetical protein
MSQIGHLHVTRVHFERQRDHVWFLFKTYRQSATEWGYELVRANGGDTSTGSDPDFWSEKDAIAAIHSHADFFEWIPGYGWCIPQEAQVPAGHKGSGVVTLPTSRGDADARRMGIVPQGDIVWRIDYPWGDSTFTGNLSQLQDEMHRNIAENDVAHEADQSAEEPASAFHR